MTNELKLLETVSLPYEAENLRGLLESVGITAFVEGVHASNTFGMNALMGSIKIKVRSEDLSRARQALADASNRVGREWVCDSCQEPNEANFDICWKCGSERCETAAPVPASALPEPTAFQPEEMVSEHPVTSLYNSAPYAPPSVAPELPSHGAGSVAITSAAQSEYEDSIERAYRASVLGLVTLPGLLHIYSFMLLLGTLGLPASTTPALTWRFRAAMLIDMIVFVAGGWLVSLFFRQV